MLSKYIPWPCHYFRNTR